MRRRSKVWKSTLLIAWIIWFIDVVSKTWAITSLQHGKTIKILGDFLTLTLSKNSGAAFSFATGSSTVFAILAILVIFSIAYWAPRITSRSWALVLGLVLGGTMGNFSDRLFRDAGESRPRLGSFKGEVIDWIRLPHWPIFNFADSAIVVGAVIATILSFRNIHPISISPDRDGKVREGE